MATDVDTLTRGRAIESPSQIAGMFRPAPQPEAVSPPPEGGPETFDPESADYKAYGWAGNKTLPSLRLIRKDGSEKAIQYAHLDSQCPDGGCEFLPSVPGRKGNVIRLRVAGHGPVFLIFIEGIRLRRVWELIMSHLTPWIHELPADADFSGGSDPVIWSFAFKSVGTEPDR
jgi:hypothetical protein